MTILYLAIIALSNVVTAMFAPISLFGEALLIPTGSVFVGITFILRDLVQMKKGKRFIYWTILIATGISAVISLICGDSLCIAFASVAAFAISESVDTEIFERLKRSVVARVIVSGLAGGVVDSVVFVTLGLSPIGANIIGWEAVPTAILGQMLMKTLVQPIGALGFLGKKNDNK